MGHKGGYMKNALYVQRGTFGLKQCQTAKKIKPVALVIIKLRESEGIRQAVSQSIENSVK